MGEKVVDDWYGDGRVDQIFPAHCYLDAIRSLPVDVKDYSNAEEDIRRALAYARLHKTDPVRRAARAHETSTAVEPPTTHGGGDTSGPGSSVPVDIDRPWKRHERGAGVDTSGPSSVPIRSSSSVVSRCSCSPRAVSAT